MHNFINLTGKQFGRLTVVSRATNDRAGYVRWLCHCHCGQEKIIHGASLKRGLTKSCGCIRHDQPSPVRTHGKSHTPTWYVWISMKQRCDNPKVISYKNYGGRGITYDPNWKDFSIFLADMGERPQGTEIDRIDNNGPYSKENCRWISRKQQNRNTRTNIMITYNGQTKCMGQWAEEFGIKANTLRRRIICGWPVDIALTLPISHHRRLSRGIEHPPDWSRIPHRNQGTGQNR